MTARFRCKNRPHGAGLSRSLFCSLSGQGTPRKLSIPDGAGFPPRAYPASDRGTNNVRTSAITGENRFGQAAGAVLTQRLQNQLVDAADDGRGKFSAASTCTPDGLYLPHQQFPEPAEDPAPHRVDEMGCRSARSGSAYSPDRQLNSLPPARRSPNPAAAEQLGPSGRTRDVGHAPDHEFEHARLLVEPGLLDPRRDQLQLRGTTTKSAAECYHCSSRAGLIKVRGWPTSLSWWCFSGGSRNIKSCSCPGSRPTKFIKRSTRCGKTSNTALGELGDHRCRDLNRRQYSRVASLGIRAAFRSPHHQRIPRDHRTVQHRRPRYGV